MKKIINKLSVLLLTVAAIAVSSCGNKKEENVSTLSANEIIKEVDTVIAIGKVNGEEGSTLIASNTSGIVNKLLVKEGDTVKKGDVLMMINHVLEQLDVALANTKLQGIQEQNNITQKDIERENIYLAYLKERLNTSKKLYEKKAETMENFLNDEVNYQQQRKRIEALKDQINVNKSQIKEQQLALEKVILVAQDYTILAQQSGVITSLNVQLGQNVNTNESLGEIIDISKIIIDAEVDELFADRIAVGQQVTFININTKQDLGKGEVIYASPILANKSILFETANEADDRRVRKLKIKPTSGQHFLINSKLECQINLK